MGITQTHRRANVLRGQIEDWCEEMCAVTPVEDWGEALAWLLEHWACLLPQDVCGHPRRQGSA